MKITHITNTAIEAVTYPKSLEREVSANLITQYLLYVQSRTVKKVGHTKTRGEVSGTGKKPWKQKGTGRARHGSTRSPIWTGGGVAFGPRREQERELRMNKKMRRQALAALLTDAAKENRLAIAEFDQAEPKVVRSQIGKFCDKSKVVLVLSDQQTSPLKVAANLANADSVTISRFGAKQLQSNRKIVLDKESFNNLEQRLK